MTPLNKQAKGNCSRLSHTNQAQKQRWTHVVQKGKQVMPNFVIYGELFALNQGFYMSVYAT